MLHEAITMFAGAAALAPSCRRDLELLLEELVTNIFNHGYRPDRPGHVHIGLRFFNDTVRITMCDRAPAFDPLAHKPDNPVMLESANIGGAGIALMRRLTTDRRYVRVAGRNMLAMHLRKASRKD